MQGNFMKKQIAVIASLVFGCAIFFSCAGNKKAVKNYERAVLNAEKAFLNDDEEDVLKWLDSATDSLLEIDYEKLSEKDIQKINELQERLNVLADDDYSFYF